MPMLLKWLVVILFLHACEAGGGSGRGKKTPTPTTIRSTTTTSTALPLHECFYSCARNHNPRLDCLNWNSSDSCSESANLNDEDCSKLFTLTEIQHECVNFGFLFLHFTIS
ncbi:unnamed protein product [Trichobilharzia szidati]|nr:unnamed protein product [Trichobilharzia szidati]